MVHSSKLLKLTALLFLLATFVILFNMLTFYGRQPMVEFEVQSEVQVVSPKKATVSTLPTTTEAIVQYLRNEELGCLEERRELDKNKNLCPCLPNNLLGRIVPNVSTDFQWSDLSRSTSIGDNGLRHVLAGGQWKPAHCVSDNRMAVIVPCRDRDSHLRVLLRHLIPILQRQLAHFMIFVVEQKSPAVFNKAAMMNIGFLEAERRFPEMNCLLFHDVDHMMEDDRSLLNCRHQVHHYATGMDEWNYRLIYGAAFGGVVTMRPSMFRKVNGYSLTYFGWGGEDDDMGSRVRKHSSVFRPPIEVARYTTLRHMEDKSNPRNHNRHKIMSDQAELYSKGIYDGISVLNYTLNDVQLRPFYTWIHANLDVIDLPYPKHFVGEYVKLSGVCVDRDINVFSTSDVSWTTCRYLCDVELNRPCSGFTYYMKLNTESTTAKCELLRTVCKLTTVFSPVGLTYLKISIRSRVDSGVGHNVNSEVSIFNAVFLGCIGCNLLAVAGLYCRYNWVP